MSFLHNKNIVLGVTGGIAAYKSIIVVRLLKQQGANVRVVMTDAAREFITPLSFQAVSANPVHSSLLDTEAEAAMGHIELARWADVVIIAPASANTIANLASGSAGDLLSTLCLATSAPVTIAPAMNQAMWAKPSTADNIDCLQQRGVQVLGPASGEQACGDIGEGRMLEAEEIVEALEQMFNSQLLSGVRVMLTAGPTREAIDPVRYISNHSSGKMGYALAQAALEAGASVELISGPCTLAASDRIQLRHVESAEQMLQAVEAEIDKIDIFIAVAAVADYRPQQVAGNKIKKTDETMTLQLVKNPDILATVASRNDKPFCVGFAAETEQLEDYARKKLQQKNLDMIFANRVDSSELGFNSDYNSITALWRDGEQVFDKTTKSRLASELVSLIAQHYHQKDNGKP